MVAALLHFSSLLGDPVFCEAAGVHEGISKSMMCNACKTIIDDDRHILVMILKVVADIQLRLRTTPLVPRVQEFEEQ